MLTLTIAPSIGNAMTDAQPTSNANLTICMILKGLGATLPIRYVMSKASCESKSKTIQ